MRRAPFLGRSALLSFSQRQYARIQLSDVEVGDCFQRENRWWTVHQVFGNVKKGSETAQSKIVLQDVLTGAKKEVRVKSAEKVETVEMMVKECTIIEMEKGNVKVKAVDDEEDEMSISAGEGHLVHYLQPGMTVLVRLLDDRPLRVEPPKHVRVKVKSIPPRADQAAETKRIAILENGRKIKVPGHIEVGQEIVVRPEDESYVGTE